MNGITLSDERIKAARSVSQGTATTADIDATSDNRERGRKFFLTDDLYLHISGGDPDSKEFWELCDRMKEIADLQENWDTYGAKRISAEAIQDAFNLIFKVQELVDQFSLPQVVPTPEGSIQIEWFSPEKEIELERIDSDTWELYCEDLVSGDVIESTVSHSIKPLIELM